MKIERFVKEYKPIAVRDSGEDYCYDWICTIFDRMEQKDIITIDTSNKELNDELAEQLLTMLNIKFMGVKEE